MLATVESRVRRRRSAGSVVLVYYFTNAVAELLQGVALLWATYALTRDSLLVGVVNAVAYLPGVVTGLAFRRRADHGEAGRLLGSTNWMLAIGSAILVLVWYADRDAGPLIGAFVAVQVSLSVAKMMNKAYVARFVRDQFAPAEARTVLERGTSLTMVGGLVGGACAGVLLDTASAGICFAGAAGLYLASLGAVQLGARRLSRPAEPPQAAAASANPGTGLVAATDADVTPGTDPGIRVEPVHPLPVSPRARPRDLERLLWIVLVFSIPSSGAIPFVSTILVPLAQSTSPGSGGYYSALTILCALGGFIAGHALARQWITPRIVLNLALPAAALLAAALAPFLHGAIVVAALVLVVSGIVTLHVILMQVLTNQAPDPRDVGRFAILRNSFANTAKGGFSLACGGLVQVAGLSGAWLALGGVLAVFAVIWMFVPRSAIVTLAT